jgi:hypothetical protein
MDLADIKQRYDVTKAHQEAYLTAHRWAEQAFFS